MFVSSLIDPIREPDAVVVPPQASVLLARLDQANLDQIAAEIRKLETIHELCLAYRAVDEGAFGEAAEKLVHRGADGTPVVTEYLSLEVAALLGMSPASGAGLIGEVLNCVYRHPLMWGAVRAGRVRWYRATEIISVVNAAQLCHDAAIWVDEQLAPSLATLSRRRILNLAKGYVALADVTPPESARLQRGLSDTCGWLRARYSRAPVSTCRHGWTPPMLSPSTRPCRSSPRCSPLKATSPRSITAAPARWASWPTRRGRSSYCRASRRPPSREPPSWCT
ncbi:MAG: hypothetical protein ACOH16_03765 [Propionibacteriaceae bacterium]